jgi:hypothetical protein
VSRSRRQVIQEIVAKRTLFSARRPDKVVNDVSAHQWFVLETMVQGPKECAAALQSITAIAKDNDKY